MVLQLLMNPRVLRILLAVGALGFIVSHPLLLGWLGQQSPWYAFALWYVVFFAFIAFVGVTVLPGRFQFRHAVGLLVLWLGISPVLGWADNVYLSKSLTGADLTGVEAGPEETVFAWLWLHVTSDVNTVITLVYVVMPVLLVFAALVILRPAPFMKAFRKLVHM